MTRKLPRRIYFAIVAFGLLAGMGSHSQTGRHADGSDILGLNQLGRTRILMQTEQFLVLLKKGNNSERMTAAKRLGEQKARKAVPALVDALNDPNQYVRGWAAWALSEIGDPAAIGPLIAAFIKYDQISKMDRDFEESKCLTSFYLALEQLTGQKFGLDVEKWKKWYQEM